jgi:3-carboxy-cis,cis-muconate cycloisomerase
MLDAEAALARACAGTLIRAPPLISSAAADAIEAACRAERFDIDRLGRAAAEQASPVIPLVAELRAAVGGELAAWVHVGATSQDILIPRPCWCSAERWHRC